MTATVRFAYKGPSVDDGSIDIETLGPALLAMGNLFYDANRVLNGDRVSATVRVKAFQHGSFGVELLCDTSAADVAQQLPGLVRDPITTAKEIVGLLVGVGGAGWGVLRFIRWLKGETPESSHIERDGSEIVVRGDGNKITVDNRVVKLALNPDVQQDVQSIVSPVRREGIRSLAIEQDGRTHEQIEKSEASLYDTTPTLAITGELIDDRVVEAWLGIAKAAFIPGLSWMFNPGDGQRFIAKVPSEFEDRVKREQILFGPGDRVFVEMRVQSEDVGGDIRLHRQILRVMKLHSAGRQKTFERTVSAGRWSGRDGARVGSRSALLPTQADQ